MQYKDDKTGWKDDVTGDIGRIDRQQFFLRQVFDVARLKALSPDIRGTNELLNAVVANVKVDKSMDVNRMAAIGRRFASKTSDELVSWSLPVIPYNTAGGASVVRLAGDEATPILDVFRGLTPDAWPTWAIKMTVTGASGKPGDAATTEKALKEMGFVVAGTSEVKSPQKRTTIKHPSGYHRIAIEVARRLNAGADVVEDRAISDFTLVLTLGADYAGTSAEVRPMDEVTRVPGSATTQPAAAAGRTNARGTQPPLSSTTSSTELVVGGKNLVGVVPGKPPDGVTCNR